MHFIEQHLNQSRNSILSDAFFADPDIVVGERWALLGLPEIEVGHDDTMGQHVANGLLQALKNGIRGVGSEERDNLFLEE